MRVMLTACHPFDLLPRSKYLWLSDVEDKALYCGAFQQVVLVHFVLLITVCAIRMGK